MNLEKLYHDLNKTLITATNALDDSMFDVNLSKNLEVGYLALESFQLKLSTVTKGIFQQ